jgi:hypothetical protein
MLRHPAPARAPQPVPPPRSPRRRARAVLAAALAGTALAAVPVGAPPAAAAEPPLAWEVVLERHATDPTGWNRSSSPALGDLDGDGIDEIVIGHQDGIVRAFRADGSMLWAAGVSAHPNPIEVRSPVDSSPTIVDLDGDGTREVVVGLGSTWVHDRHGGLVVLNRDGSTRWRWTGNRDFAGPFGPQDDGILEAVFTTPAVGDVDGDGRLDIVFAGFDQRIHALDRDGGDVPGFPVHADDTVWSSPALFDVDGDGRQEIFIGGDSAAGSSIDIDGGVFRGLDWRDGGVHDLWAPRLVDETVMSSPAIGDIDGDGRAEAVVGTGDYWSSTTGRPRSITASRSVFAWHLDDGSPVAGWPRQVADGTTKASPAIGDVDGDGRDDVVIGTSAGWVHAWHGDGRPLWQVVPPTDPLPPQQFHGGALIADVDGVPGQEVVIAGGFAVHVLDGRTGAQQSSVQRFWSHDSTPTIGAFGPSGWLLVAAGFDTPHQRTRLGAWRIPAPSAADWPTWRQDGRHQGVAASTPRPTADGRCRPDTNPPARGPGVGRGYWILGADGAVHPVAAPALGDPRAHGGQLPTRSITATPSGGGYWVLGADGGVFSFGDAGFHGSTGGMALNAPVVGMAPTPSGNGYWLLGADGGVFSYGDAGFHGSTGGMALNAPVIGMAATRSGHGYWLLAADGGVFSYGDAAFHGSTGGMALAAPVVGLAADPRGAGYWLLGADGGVFSFDVPFHGSVPGTGLCRPPAVAAVQATPTGGGYWVLGADGGVFTFGDAAFLGSRPGLAGPATATDLAVRP